MRHYNPVGNSWITNDIRLPITKPYSMNYKFTKPQSSCRYVKALLYVNDHPKCSRFDILVGCGIIGNSIVKKHGDISKAKHAVRGRHSSMFAQMLYADIIDYDKKFKYSITEAGKKILRDVFLMNMEKIVRAG